MYIKLMNINQTIIIPKIKKICNKNVTRRFLLTTLCLITIVVLTKKYLSIQSADYFVPSNLRHFLSFTDDRLMPSATLSAETLREIIEHSNSIPEVMNWQRHGVVHSDTVVLTVQVARDLSRLQYLVTALAQVRDINTVLVIFSHSHYDERINQLVRNIRFCRVMQLFYPNSLQLNPNSFPGVDPNDCTSNESHVHHGIPLACHDRDARTTEHKQQWWWTTHFVFERLPWLTNFVVFLQEDDYVSPDLLHMLRYLRQASDTYIKGTDVISLGRRFVDGLDWEALIVDAWRPPYDRGLAFDRRMWGHVKEWAQFFCMYDDSSWSYSLLNEFEQSKQRGYVRMVASEAPRVLSTRGFENARLGAEASWRVFSQARLFPENVRAIFKANWAGKVENAPVAPPRGNGGFQDIRDQLLCLEPMLSTTTEDEETTTTSTIENEISDLISETDTYNSTATENLDYNQ